jgi:hypothetical protein
MKTDLYTKVILTVIAICLITMLFKTEKVMIKDVNCILPVKVSNKQMIPNRNNEAIPVSIENR